MTRVLVTAVLMAALLLTGAQSLFAAERLFRLGYLDHAGSGLCRIAELQGHYREEGLKVELVRLHDSRTGLKALDRKSTRLNSSH